MQSNPEILEEAIAPKMVSVVNDDYGAILSENNISFKAVGYFLYVGERRNALSWILHLSLIAADIPAVLKTILPLLMYENVPFKVAATKEIAKGILNGHLGYTQLGKVVAIYPVDNNQAISLARQLIGYTIPFRGPKILTDQYLGGCVYVRYGSHQNVIPQGTDGANNGHLINDSGSAIQDQYTIPFALPAGMSWPFQEFASAVVKKQETVLQDRYKLMEVLKEDARGNVKKSLRLEKWWRVKWCVIKEGRQNMFADDYGRDIRDRLLWQFEVQKDLEGVVAVPKVYELFEENGDTYLAMEYIKGLSLSNSITQIFRDRHWSLLDSKDQLNIFDYAIGVIDLVNSLHVKGYVHRDVNPDNILCDRSLKLIDVELVYSLSKKYPDPPFKWGTPWFMSPEQQAAQTPTIQEDVYAIGATLLAIFTGLLPNKFSITEPHILKKQLGLFLPFGSMAQAIVPCFDFEPLSRPSLASLKEELVGARNQITKDIKFADSKEHIFCSEPEELIATLQRGVQGLGTPLFLEESDLWPSLVIEEEKFAYYQTETKTVYPGFYSGLGGICYVLARLHKMGFSIRSCMPAYNRSIHFIREHLHQAQRLSAGLYAGSDGMMVALGEALHFGLAKTEKAILQDLSLSVQNNNTEGLGVVKGMAGKGMAMLHISSLLPTNIVKPILDNCIDTIINAQQSDGSWLITTDDGKGQLKITGFDHGIAGICCFLCGYASIYQGNIVQEAVAKALQYLRKKAVKNGGQIAWSLHDKSKAIELGLQAGSTGIVLAFIKGYQLLGEGGFKEVADSALFHFSRRIIGRDLTLGSGLAGLGETYIEAYSTFGNQEWKDRADWITQFLLHTFQQQADGSRYWLPTSRPSSSADLLFGNAGILHFLLRSLPTCMLGHPLLPYESGSRNKYSSSK